MGLRLSQADTQITHIDEGLDFLGWRIQRHRRQEKHLMTLRLHLPRRRKALTSITGKVKAICQQDQNPGPGRSTGAAPTQPGVARLDHLLPAGRVVQNVRVPARFHLAPGDAPAAAQAPAGAPGNNSAAVTAAADGGPPRATWILFNPTDAEPTTRYRYRGAQIPSPWPTAA